MDAGNGSHSNGNGKADPSAALPQSSPPAGGDGLPPEPLVVVDDAPRGKDGKFRAGKSGNPKGRPPGTPNLNNEICRAAKAFKLGDKTYMFLLLAKSLQDPEYAKLVVPRLFADATEGKPLIDASDNSQHHHSENHVSIGEHLADASTRDAVAQLTERLAARGAFAGEPRHVRQ